MELVDFGPRGVLGREPGSHAFEGFAQIEDLGEVSFGQLAHHQTGRRGVDQAFGLELAQRFAHRRAADVKIVSQRVATQPVAWGKLAVEDASPQRSVDRVGRGADVPGAFQLSAT